MAGIFGNGYTPPWMTPGYGDGTPQGSLGMPTPQLGDFTPAPDQFADQRPQGGGIFGRLKNVDWGSVLLGGIADGVATWGGARPGYASAMAEQNEERRELAKAKLLAQLRASSDSASAERERTARMEDWMAQQQWQRDNPDPTTAARMAIEAGHIPGTPAYQQFITTYAQRPIMMGGEAYSYGPPGGGESSQRTVVRTGTANGRKVVQYSDGSIEYGD